MEQEMQARRAAAALREHAVAVAGTEDALAALLAAPDLVLARLPLDADAAGDVGLGDDDPALDPAAFDDEIFEAALLEVVQPDERLDGSVRRRRWMMSIAAAVVLVWVAAAVVAAGGTDGGEPQGALQVPTTTSVASIGAAVRNGTIELPNGVRLTHLPDGVVLERLTTDRGAPGLRADSVAELGLSDGTTLRVTITDSAPAWPHTDVVIGDEIGYVGWCDWCALSAGTPARHAALPVDAGSAWLVAEMLAPDPATVVLRARQADRAGDPEQRFSAVFDDLTSVLAHASYTPALDGRPRTS